MRKILIGFYLYVACLLISLLWMPLFSIILGENYIKLFQKIDPLKYSIFLFISGIWLFIAFMYFLSKINNK